MPAYKYLHTNTHGPSAQITKPQASNTLFYSDFACTKGKMKVHGLRAGPIICVAICHRNHIYTHLKIQRHMPVSRYLEK